MKSQYMQCGLKIRRVKVIHGRKREKRKGIKLVIIFVTIVVIDIGEVVAQHMARTAIDAKSCIILPVCVKQKR
jgi:hypothetical protein